MIEGRDGRRALVTGVGVVAPCGIGAGAFWTGLTKTADLEVVRRVPGFDPAGWGLARAQARRLDRFAQYGIACAAMALVDAGLLAAPDAAGALPGVDADRIGVLIGTGIGGAHAWEEQIHTRRDRGAKYVSPLTVPLVMPNAAAAAVSMRWDLRGPCETVSTACATGTHAVAAAARWVAAGRADVVLAGGVEACMTETNTAAFANMRALSPTGYSRPFDVARDGFCAAEAGAVLVIEEAGHATARGAVGYAEVAGSGSTADAYHVTAPAPGGRGALRCMRLALADADLASAEVTHINAHGTSTPFNDAAEAEAIRELFGTPGPAVSSIKGVTGHSLGAAGAVEAVAVALTYRHRQLPPTMGTTTVDPELGIDVVLEPRPWQPAAVLSNSFAFGGHNATVAFVPASPR